MSDQEDGALGAVVRVIRGSNRIMEVKIHCVIRDDEGIPKWDVECIGRIAIPPDYTPYGFVAEGPVETMVVPKGAY